MENLKIIDVLGKSCPVPVIEAKKALTEPEVQGVLVKGDNSPAVQNLEKLANSFGYSFSYAEKAKDFYQVIIEKEENTNLETKAENNESRLFQFLPDGSPANGFAVVITRDTMGEGAEELGRILIKGFIYSLTELPLPPKFVLFLNSGAYLTSDGANTVDDLKKLEEKGVEILTCGTCVNYYGIEDKLVVGEIANMYAITERMTSGCHIINI